MDQDFVRDVRLAKRKTGRQPAAAPCNMSCVRCRKHIGAGRYEAAQAAFRKHWKKCARQAKKPAVAVGKQCKSCPWRVGCDPDKEIPGYRRGPHCKLDKTIRSGVESILGPRQIMACHYSKPGREFACAGWLSNQLGPGNNIGIRLAVAHGDMPVPKVYGLQHERFEDTIPKEKKR